MAEPRLLPWLASLPARDRDGAVEEYLGIAVPPAPTAPLGEHMLPYQPSGVSPIVRALMEVPVVAADVVVDVGAGLGKVVLLTKLLTGASARGVELDPGFVARARGAAAARAIDVSFTAGDARDASIDDATVFFFYVPFTGPVLAAMLEKIERVASRRAIVVCALGVDLHATWLVPRPLDAFWLTIYDSVVPGVPARPPRERLPVFDRAAEAVAFDRALE